MPILSCSEENLRRIFQGGFQARDVASDLVSFDSETPAAVARNLMEARRYRVVGIRRDGRVAGYAERPDLREGLCGDHLRPFREGEIFSDSAALSEVIRGLGRSEWVFIEALGAVVGLVTRSDMQKPPVRMWLFGMITLMEMAMVRVIRFHYPEDGWMSLLSRGRLEKAKSLARERRRRYQDAKLLNCLQFSDKGQIFAKDPELRKNLRNVKSRKEAEERFKHLEKLRNNLAHSQDIITYDWDTIVAIADNVDNIIERMGEWGRLGSP